MRARINSHVVISLCSLLICLPFLFVVPPAVAGIEEHITETETGIFYTVQPGDTLWDLSKKFADSPWLWPDLWRYNPEIKNPHLIYPGQKIRIYKRRWIEKEAPPPPQKPEPVVVRIYKYKGMGRVSFIRKEPISPLGVLFHAKEDKVLISQDDAVYFKIPPESKGLVAGKTYTIFRTTGPIVDPDTKKPVGMLHIICGKAKIEKITKEYAYGKVTAVYREIRPNDGLMQERKLSDKLVIKDGVTGLKAKLITTPDLQNLIGEEMIAFINKGARQGLAPGQSYTIYHQETGKTARFGKVINLEKEAVGTALVLLAEPETSTILVTDSSDIIIPGMEVSAP